MILIELAFRDQNRFQEAASRVCSAIEFSEDINSLISIETASIHQSEIQHILRQFRARLQFMDVNLYLTHLRDVRFICSTDLYPMFWVTICNVYQDNS